jgi:uncharacterized protein involved in exopolysaccharide biosynthesis
MDTDRPAMQIFADLWAGRVLIVVTALVCGGLGATYALLATPWYRAQVTLLPMENKNAQGIAGQLGALGGLAGLAGINLGGTNKVEPLAVLSSRDFARTFIENQKILTVLLADKWDATAGKWKGDGSNKPDIRDGVEYFDKTVRKVGEDRKTGLVVLTIDWKTPTEAALWANLLAAQINSQMRARAIEDAERSIAYLRAELHATSQVSLQQSISRLLESQMQNMMMARGNTEYAFRVVDSARVPKKRFKPKRTLMALGTTMIGGFLACAWVMLRSRNTAPPVIR